MSPIILDLDSGSVGTDLSGLRAKLRGFGLDDLDDGQLDFLLNTAYLEICDMEDWGFLQAAATGASPLTVSDLRKVNTVIDSTTRAPLPLVDREYLTAVGLDVTTTGTPRFYYVGDGGDSVRTWPVGGTIAVRYYRVPPQLVSSSDEPLIPERFRDIIVLGAARVAMMSESAQGDLDSFSREYERRLDVMREALVFTSREAETIQVLAPGEDW